MRSLPTLLSLLAPAIFLGGPTYQVSQATGDHEFFFSLRQLSQPVMPSAPDNTLSTWQPLPFAWKFFGQDVRGYFVSDNGYLTFDSTAKVSVAANTTLPSAAAPRGSIFAFWADLEMTGGSGPWTNTVVSATYGTAPNRIHIVYWMSVVPKGGTFAASALSFAIAMHEGGNFEVIYTTARKSGTLAGTVGATSLDGSTAVLANGPSFDFPGVGFGGEDDRSFFFKATNQ